MTPSSSPRHPPGLAVSSLVLAAALVASAPQAFAATTLIQPGESASKDVLLYEFAIGGFFGIPTPPVSTNLDTDTLNAISPPPVPFGNFLGTSQTEPFSLSPGGDLREHGTKSLLQFDLSGVALGADRVRSATISLFAHASTKLSHIIRQAPFAQAHLKDQDLSVDFSDVTSPDDRVAVIATLPLTDNEVWTEMPPGTLWWFEEGAPVKTLPTRPGPVKKP